MNRFWEPVTRRVLKHSEATSVVEIGADRGAHTRLVADWCRRKGARLLVIDPVPGFDVAEIEDPHAGIRVDQRLSLQALPEAEPADVALVDGDHNYYTVRRELELLMKTAVDAGRPRPVMLCHDICWPYGRRDLYYDPDNIPEEHRHPWRRAGMVFGQSELAESGGLNSRLANAEHEGGPANGVLTAIEDVVEESGDLTLHSLPVLYGLGILVPAERLEDHPVLARWLRRWETPRGWQDLALMAEAERRRADERGQLLAYRLADQRRPPELHTPGRVEEVAGRSFRPAVPPKVLMSIQRGTLKTRYRGIPFLKNPFDVVLYQQLLQRLKPASVIEIGTKSGGSAQWFADQQMVNGIVGRVVSVDVEPPGDFEDPRVLILEGDALALGDVLTPELLSTLPRPWLVIEDSAHLFETSVAVLEFFDQHLRRGDYIVVEDGTLADFPHPVYARFGDGPNRAVKDFLEKRGEDYRIDTALCDHYGHNVTWAPNAWLKRLR